MTHPPLILTDLDRFRLGTLLICSDSASLGGVKSRFDLETRLEEAQAIPSEDAPGSLVTMNSTLRLIDVNSGRQRVCTLVYPEDRDLIPQSVSVFQPLGRRLLGARVGDNVKVVEAGQPIRYRIDSILYQPEAAGAFER
jgi:regulator of nucleoside diphosphate kinase